MGLAIVLLFAMHALQLYPTGDGKLPFLTRLDNILYDKRLNLTMPGSVDPSVVILDIDEKSLGEIGHWPWSRRQMAELIAKLFDRYGIAAIAATVDDLYERLLASRRPRRDPRVHAGLER